MDRLNTISEWLFWISIGWILMVTVGYPVMVFLLGLFVRRKSRGAEGGDYEPHVSLIISAYNEERVIKEKIENSLQLNYPKDKLEIIVASDGSSDKTNDIVRSYINREVQLFSYDRIGKTGIQNETVKKAKGEVLVFSDANAIYDKNAIKLLARHFDNDTIGCVCGQLTYTNNNSIHNPGEIYYWDYEKFLKERETKISSLIGVNGSIYAVRKKDYIELNTDLISDLVEPLEIVKTGKRVIYEHKAISREEASLDIKEEFNRKVRILTRSIQGLFSVKELFNPLKHGIFSIQIIVHKLFRYLIPFFLITGLLSLVYLTEHQFYYFMFCVLFLILAFSIVSKFSTNNTKFNTVFGLVIYYLIINYALIVAWFNVIKKRKITLWSTQR